MLAVVQKCSVQRTPRRLSIYRPGTALNCLQPRKVQTSCLIIDLL